MYSQLGVEMRGRRMDAQSTPTCRCQLLSAKSARGHLTEEFVRFLGSKSRFSDSRRKGMRTKILINYEGGFEVDHAAAKCDDRAG